MPDIFGNPTASEEIAIVKGNRIVSDELIKKAGVPSNQKAGKVAMVSYIVTPTNAGNNDFTIEFPDFVVIESVMTQRRNAAGLVSADTPTLTITGNTVTVNDVSMVATDIYTIIVKGIKA
jgi:hypothetical protein